MCKWVCARPCVLWAWRIPGILCVCYIIFSIVYMRLFRTRVKLERQSVRGHIYTRYIEREINLHYYIYRVLTMCQGFYEWHVSFNPHKTLKIDIVSNLFKKLKEITIKEHSSSKVADPRFKTSLSFPRTICFSTRTRCKILFHKGKTKMFLEAEPPTLPGFFIHQECWSRLEAPKSSLHYPIPLFPVTFIKKLRKYESRFQSCLWIHVQNK